MVGDADYRRMLLSPLWRRPSAARQGLLVQAVLRSASAASADEGRIEDRFVALPKLPLRWPRLLRAPHRDARLRQAGRRLWRRNLLIAACASPRRFATRRRRACALMNWQPLYCEKLTQKYVQAMRTELVARGAMPRSFRGLGPMLCPLVTRLRPGAQFHLHARKQMMFRQGPKARPKARTKEKLKGRRSPRTKGSRRPKESQRRARGPRPVQKRRRETSRAGGRGWST